MTSTGWERPNPDETPSADSGTGTPGWEPTKAYEDLGQPDQTQHDQHQQRFSPPGSPDPGYSSQLPEYPQHQYSQQEHSQPEYSQQAGFPPPGYGQQSPGYGQQPPGYPQQSAYPQPPYPAQYPAQQFNGSPYQIQPYPIQPYGGYQHPQATTAMVLGLVGLVGLITTWLFGLIGIAGIIVGRRVQREIDAQPGRWEGRNLATAGWVMGLISVIGVGVGVFAVIAIIAAFVATS